MLRPNIAVFQNRLTTTVHNFITKGAKGKQLQGLCYNNEIDGLSSRRVALRIIFTKSMMHSTGKKSTNW